MFRRNNFGHVPLYYIHIHIAHCQYLKCSVVAWGTAAVVTGDAAATEVAGGIAAVVAGGVSSVEVAGGAIAAAVA